MSWGAGMEAREFSSMTRAELRAYLHATDPQADHWMKRANRELEARLEANRIANGWPAVQSGVPAEPVIERVVPPAVERAPVRAPQPGREAGEPSPIYDRDEYQGLGG